MTDTAMNTDEMSDPLDPTNPVVLAMAIKQMQATLKELVQEVRDLSKRPTCTKPDLCISLEKEVEDLRDISKEWQKIAADREKRLAEAERLNKDHAGQIEEFEKRIAPLEEAMAQAKGAKWAVGLVWGFVTSGVVGAAFGLWQLLNHK